MKKIILLTLLTAFSSVSFAQSNVTGVSGTNDPVLDNAINQAKNQSGSYNSMAANPFSFCGAARPGKGNPMRVVWDQVCPDGKKQAAQAPVPVPSNNTTLLPNTQTLQNQFNQSNQIQSNTQVQSNQIPQGSQIKIAPDNATQHSLGPNKYLQLQ